MLAYLYDELHHCAYKKGNDMSASPFTNERLSPGTWVIHGGWCDCYLLEGDGEAIMIDAGCREHDIRAYAQSLTAKPLKSVVNTHSHIDHTGGNGLFETIYGTAGIARSAKNVMGGDPSQFALDYQFTLIQDGDTIGPEGRPLKIIVLDSHSPENIAILDVKGRYLFPGDEVERGQVLLLPGYAERPGEIHSKPAASVETFLRAVEKLKAHEDEYDLICPAHNGTPIAKGYVDRFIALAQGILDGSIVGTEDCSSPSYPSKAGHFPNLDAGYLRGELNGASLIYNSRLLRDSDYATADTLPPATRAHVASANTALQ